MITGLEASFVVHIFIFCIAFFHLSFGARNSSALLLIIWIIILGICFYRFMNISRRALIQSATGFPFT